MQLSSDIEMRNPLWERADSELCSNNQLGIFNRLVDVFVIACAIGIKRTEDLYVKNANPMCCYLGIIIQSPFLCIIKKRR